MATINDTAAEVAEAVVTEMGGYQEYPDLRKLAFTAANDGAVRMSQKLGKSIDTDKFLEETIGFQTRAVAVAQGHMQVIVLAGYAAFFALWSPMAPAIPIAATLLSGSFMMISVIVFLAWTIVGLIFTKIATERVMSVYQNGPVDFWTRYRAAESENLVGRVRLMRHWKLVVAIAGGAALISAIILVTFSAISFVTKLTAPAPSQPSNFIGKRAHLPEHPLNLGHRG